MQNNSDVMQQAIRMMKTPAGQQIIHQLQEKGGDALQQALAKAASGDFAQAKTLLSSLLEDPQMKNLLEQMGG